MTEKTNAPTAEKIDELARLYAEAQAATEYARKCESELRDEIYHLVEKFGSVPRRATKSKRLEGDEYQLTLSKGHSVEINSAGVALFWKWMKVRDMARLFRKLFKRETVFVMQEGAHEAVTQTVSELTQGPIEGAVNVEAATMAALFQQCLSIRDTSPTVKAELRKKEKKQEAAA